ncbi:MAG: hypothetical protein AAF411_17870 [Myxococcota bacterium]
MRSLLALFLLAFVACGDDDGGSDAAVDMAGANALGQVCTTVSDCPADHNCAMPPLVGGSMTQGYCSPNCSDAAACTTGYTGPGRPSCFLMPACTISCDTPNAPGECPDGLTCLPTGGPTSACGVAE